MPRKQEEEGPVGDLLWRNRTGMGEISQPPTTGQLESGTDVSRSPSPSGGRSSKSDACPLCGLGDRAYLFLSRGGPVCRCTNCGLTHLQPQATGPSALRSCAEGTGHDPLADDLHLARFLVEQGSARLHSRAQEGPGASGSGILLMASTGGPFATMAPRHGQKIETVLAVQELSRSALPGGHYDGAVIILQLEKAGDPMAVLEQIHAALKPNGMLLLVTPSTDSWPARFFRDQWVEWREENLYYFDRQTIQSALLRSGFADIEITRDYRSASLKDGYGRGRACSRAGLARLVRAMYHVVPVPLRRRLPPRLAASCIVVSARRVERRTRPLLSIIMPVYNERPTFPITMGAVVAKEVPGVDKEIVVVESNSTDGTRELVLGYQDRPGVKVVLEDRPSGKGSAVRTGFKHAEGDFILIQDGDQEYDVNDYDALIEPLRTYGRAFVLGSRHIAGDWKVRTFIDQPVIAAFFNLGHVLFATALNLMYGQRMRDPFTMYKVFRRDCLHGLEFDCNRFDFDFELVIKLVRKGYVPLEIPVNYRSRSLKQGKKVSMVTDPWTWLWALIRFRFSPLYAPASKRTTPQI